MHKESVVNTVSAGISLLEDFALCAHVSTNYITRLSASSMNASLSLETMEGLEVVASSLVKVNITLGDMSTYQQIAGTPLILPFNSRLTGYWMVLIHGLVALAVLYTWDFLLTISDENYVGYADPIMMMITTVVYLLDFQTPGFKLPKILYFFVRKILSTATFPCFWGLYKSIVWYLLVGIPERVVTCSVTALYAMTILFCSSAAAVSIVFTKTSERQLGVCPFYTIKLSVTERVYGYSTSVPMVMTAIVFMVLFSYKAIRP
ncbi:hypothetical protein CONPUDRAFT_74599 [Coniophora puteana RWD-64-598 SS2]|uniref:Uncharacterized protein n=1 Tax=Coniophora puteana (strain RWD-64-598) TaxID=741705 RepID=A0A5M3MIL1_CONPW|nr:uncharacterized protein CONPUDRAFT_74599 [Coniophora puteana RWD-64-598 SS2]EIW79078.1 hypothetical protein CONPUDRAFT_74599 [Coniophora puteana RWD-64-598 SS2]